MKNIIAKKNSLRRVGAVGKRSSFWKKPSPFGAAFLMLIIVASMCAIIFSPSITSGHEIFGTSVEEQYSELEEQERKKAEYEHELSRLQADENTLANQISYLNSLIGLTLIEQSEIRVQIEDTQKLLEDTTENIGSLVEKTGYLTTSIENLNTVLSARIRAGYQLESMVHPGIFDKKSAENTLLQLAYLQALQQEDNKLIERMLGTRQVYSDQKVQLENLKEEKEILKSQLENQNTALEEQKSLYNEQQATKQWLLGVTRNEEARYQTLLAQIEEEIRAIKAALVNVGTIIGDVKKGDVIAKLGNTGCSTGAHLHFGYYIGGVASNPMSLITSGVFSWPVYDPVITQTFNDPSTRSWYQANFGMDGHNGIDLVDGTISGEGAPILAVADGVAYRVSDSKACFLTGTVGQGVRIDHPDGSQTIYWHVQP